MKESKLQSKIIQWLKSKGCYVIKTHPGMGTPTGCPDIVALVNGGGWLALEIKATPKSRLQPLQKVTVDKLDEMYYSKIIHIDNWDEIKSEIERII